jgi:hypothetical protein
MSNEDDLRDILNNAIREMGGMDSNPSTWLTWILYLLKGLQQQAMDVNPAYQTTYDEMLSYLQDVIRRRLNTGGW